MSTENAEVVAPATEVPATDVKEVVQDTPEVTAAPEEVDKPEQAPDKTFTQAEVDAMIQKRLLKEERRIHRRIEAQQREQLASKVAAVEPQRDEFRDDAAFEQAQIEHLAAKRAEQLLAEREAVKQQEARAETFLEKAEKVAERYPDFQAVVSNPSLPINDHMAEFIAESENGADVAYFLGKNPIRAAQIAKLSPVGAARELVKIEAELASKPKPSPSKAPEPIKPVGTRGKPSSSSMPSDDDPIEVWMKKEQARVRAR